MSSPPEAHGPDTLGDFLAKWAREQPRRAFLRTPAGRELGYGALLEQSARFAAALCSRGVTPGERVVARVETSPEAVLLYVACLRLGAVFVPANPAGTIAEFQYLLRDADARLTVVSPGERESLRAVAQVSRNCRLETLGSGGDGSLAELAQHSPPAGLNEPPAPGSLAALVYTSGTTGRPKGAMLTQANLVANAVALAHAWRFSAQDQLLHALPLFNVHGLFVAINTVVVSGAGLVLLPKFDAAAVLQHLPQATVFMGVPTHYTRLLQEPGLDRDAAARVRLFVSGSAPLLPQTLGRFRERTGQTILERYGMTETLMNTSNPYAGARIPGSVGLPLEGVAVRVTERAGGATVSTGTIGALEVKGPNVCAGYWRDPQKSRGAFSADGWFRTGDLGRIDAKGYVWIVGRATDLVISGGYNVYPKEVEAELDAVPGVAESAVFGVPHADLGEGVTAAVVLKSGAMLSEAQLLERVRVRLSGYKVPKRIVFVPELPRNTMGKVRKDALRASYASLYAAR
jgi:malonyl-CoA/methylmalonyl-CoA synthetase